MGHKIDALRQQMALYEQTYGTPAVLGVEAGKIAGSVEKTRRPGVGDAMIEGKIRAASVTRLRSEEPTDGALRSVSANRSPTLRRAAHVQSVQFIKTDVCSVPGGAVPSVSDGRSVPIPNGRPVGALGGCSSAFTLATPGHTP